MGSLARIPHKVSRCRSLRVTAAAHVTCSRAHSGSVACPTLPPTSPTTSWESTWTLRPTLRSRRACPKVLPRPDRPRIQRHPPRCWRDREQEDWWPHRSQACARACRARRALPPREEFLNRVKTNDAAKIEAKKEGTKVVTKRQPRTPKAGFTVKKAEVHTRAPVPYDPIY